MFGFKSGLKKDASDKAIDKVTATPESTGLLTSLRQKLGKTRSNLSTGLGNLLLGKKQIDADLLEQLEDELKRSKQPPENENGG